MAKRRKNKQDVNETEKREEKLNIVDWLHLPPNEFNQVCAEVCDFRGYLTQNGKISKNQATEEQKKRIETMEEIVRCEEGNLEENKKFISDVDSEIKEAEEEVRKATEILQKKQDYRRKLIRRQEFIKNQIQEAGKTLKVLKEAFYDMNNIILVHTSVTLNQLKQYQAEDIIVSKVDSPFFFQLEKRTDGNFSIDGIFEQEKNENFVTELPSNFFYKYNPSVAKSIIDYCEMVINIKLREDDSHKVILLFNNNDINKILKLNGLEEL